MFKDGASFILRQGLRMKCFANITSASELADVISQNLANALDHSFHTMTFRSTDGLGPFLLA
jgi:hypothetical protein